MKGSIQKNDGESTPGAAEYRRAAATFKVQQEKRRQEAGREDKARHDRVACNQCICPEMIAIRSKHVGKSIAWRE